MREKLAMLAGCERGVELIEVIGYFPFVLLMFVLAWQLLLVGYTGLMAANAAREGARAAVVFEDVDRAITNASPGYDGRREWAGLAGYPCASNDLVTIQVRLEAPHVFLPFVGALGHYPKVEQQASMRCEPQPIIIQQPRPLG